jgi:ribose transport system ATP-binding protein
VAENLFLGHAPSKFGIIAKRARIKRAAAVLEKLDARVKPTDVVGALSIAGQQLTAIARSLTLDAKLIIMDESSTALTEQELTRVFATIRELVKDGRSILYVSHRLQEVMEIGHRATIMRDGRTVQEVEVSQVKEQDLVMAMVGQHRSLIERLARKSVPKEVAFQVDSLEGPEGVQVKDFTVRVGEIVGLAGLNGSGRTTFLRIIFGDLKAIAGPGFSESRILQRTLVTQLAVGSAWSRKIGKPRDSFSRQVFAVTRLYRACEGGGSSHVGDWFP